MRNLKKVLCLTVCLAVLFTTLLTGCSPKEEPAAGGDAPANETPKEVQTITYYGFSEWVGDPKVGAVYQEVVDQFEKDNPGYKVELQHDPWGTWETKYKTMFASGNAPDVMIVNNPDFPVFANGDHLLDLGDVVGDEYFKDFFPGVLGMYTWNGKKMAFPFTTDCRVLWYNKDIFEKAGLDPNKPPTTWAELKEYAEKCTMDTDNDGKVDVYGFGADYALKFTPQASIFCASNGSFINVSSDGTITPTVSTPEVKGWMQLLVDMKPYYEPDFMTLNHQQVSTLFAQKKVAMIVAGFWPWKVNTGLDQETFYAHALVPKMDENAPEGSFGGGFGIAVSKNSENAEAAAKFAQMLVDPKYNARLMSDIPATNKGLAESDFNKDPKYSMFMEQIQYARQGMPKTLYFPQIDTGIQEVTMNAVLGNKTVDEAIIDMEKMINDIVKGN